MTPQRNEDGLTGSSSAEESQNKEKSGKIVRTKLEGTPFHLLTSEQGSCITMGDYRVTEIVETATDANLKLSTEMYNIIMNCSVIIANKIFDQRVAELKENV